MIVKKSMTLDYLYRFRSIDALLDGHKELETQQIYFCPPDKLNDPLEGFKDIFWRGDKIVWRNLLRHYLLNLLQSTSIASIMGEEFSLDMCMTFARQTEDDLPQAPIRKIYSAACEKFFEHSTPNHLISFISSKSKSIRRDELIYYLRLIHPLAISAVLEVLSQRGLVLVRSLTELDAMAASMSQTLEELLRLHSDVLEVPEDLYSASEAAMAQLALMHDFYNPIVEDRRGWLFIMRDFPNYYVTSLEQILYPDWHVSCFVENPINSSMWGAYADSHRGACLKFKTRLDSNGIPTLNLYRANSWSGGKDGVVANYAYVPHRFEKVRYTSEFPEVDFFESLGTLPRFKLDGFWFAGHNGERSTTALRMLREDESWREEYWRKFSASFSTKSSEWGHEEEHRLILYSNLQRFDDLESRRLKYQFTDLTGIVFGIKTPTEDKLRIMRIVEQKCAAEKRQDFEFHQAYYCNQTKKIKLAPLTMLKLNGAKNS